MRSWLNLTALSLTVQSAEGSIKGRQAYMSKQKQPRRLADADVGVFGAASSPSRSATIALVVSSALCCQAASRQAQVDVATPTPVDHAERANKWVVLALSGTATFMTTLDSSIVNIGLPSIARAFR